MIYAHTPNTRGEWHTLSDHLNGTARLAEQFASVFGAGNLGRAAGKLHDVGKCGCTFSSYLETCAREDDATAKARYPHRDHKMAGAVLASRTNKRWGVLLASAILGHHSGMPNIDMSTIARIDQMASDQEVLGALRVASSELDLSDCSLADYPDWFDAQLSSGIFDRQQLATDVEMYMRFVFSALVDADWLDTEAHFSPEKRELREEDRGLDGLLDRFEDRRQAMLRSATDSPVNIARSAIYEDLMRSVDLPPGLYKVAAPTGSGKTILGLGWALRHAKSNGLRRIVTAVPFISVTDQVASVYRDFLDTNDDRVVLEHHSQVVGGDGWQRLASENWDTPVVVTTTVRLFEALFSNRTSDCRRLHRLAGSAIILDEVQALPVEVLDPIVDALRTLVTRLGATVLLLTATQPTLQHIPLSRGVEAVDLLPGIDRWDETFKRTERSWVGSLDHAEVAYLVSEREQCLCIVNSIKDAEIITTMLGDDDSIHLTTHIRPGDRRDRLQEIRNRLDAGLPCRVVSTQLVEAGVDLDFPSVLRALAPLPSLMQADGRCNRNGLLDGYGETIVFELKKGKRPRGSYYSDGSAITKGRLNDPSVDPWTPEGIEDWYKRFFTKGRVTAGGRGNVDFDSHSVQEVRYQLKYKDVADRFKMINEDTRSVVVPWDETDKRSWKLERALGYLRNNEPCGRASYRVLQDATISLRTKQLERCVGFGLAVQLGSSDTYVWVGPYDDKLGLIVPSFR